MPLYFPPKGLNYESAQASLSYLKNIFFSEGTYQIEFYDPKEKKSFWPFVQIDKEGRILDSFCTCQEEVSKGFCLHLNTAIYFIIRKGPLHTRFRDSFWNKLCLMAFNRYGNKPFVFEKVKEKHCVVYSASRDILFSIEIRTDHGQKILDEMLFNRSEETEETSEVEEEEDMFTEFFDVVNNLLGDMEDDFVDSFVASEDFPLFQSVGNSPADCDDETRADFFSMINRVLGELPEDKIENFITSPGFVIYQKMGDLYS